MNHQLVLIFLLLLHTSMSLSSSLTTSSNYKYCYSGKRSIYIGSVTFPTGTYYPSGPSSVNPATIQMSFIRPMNNTVYKSTASIESIYTLINVKKVDIRLNLNNLQQSYFEIDIISTMINKVSVLTFRWMVIASTWVTVSGHYFSRFTHD